jgi:hypothetical protein
MTSLAFLFAVGWRHDPVPGFVPADWLLLAAFYVEAAAILWEVLR